MRTFVYPTVRFACVGVCLLLGMGGGFTLGDEPPAKPEAEPKTAVPEKTGTGEAPLTPDGAAKSDAKRIEADAVKASEGEKRTVPVGKAAAEDGKKNEKAQDGNGARKTNFGKSAYRIGKVRGVDEITALSARSVLDETLRANLRIRSQKLEGKIAKEQLRGEWGIFEPDFIATVAREANYRQNTRQQFLSQGSSTFNERNRIASVGIETLLPTGGKLQVNATNRRLRNNLQNINEKENESFVGFTLTQPLLKNAGWGATAAQIRLAAAQSKVVFQEYRKQLMLVLSQAELAYWDLVAARAFAGLRDQSVTVAERVLTDNKARVVAGKMTEIEVLQAESGLAVRRATTAEAGQKIVAATAQLNAFFGRAGQVRGTMWPADSLNPPALRHDVTESLLAAYKSHPLYLAQIEKSRQDDIRLAFTKNQRLPQLDLKTSYGYNGLGSSFTSSEDVVGSTQFPSWYFGFELRIPIGGGIKARSQAHVAQLRKEQGLLELKAIEVELTTAVSTLVHKVNAAREKAHGYREVVKVDERLLDNEMTRLAEGKSDSRKVLQAEQDLADARVSELDARLEWQRAYVELLVQTGTYLAKRDHEISEEH